MITILGSITYEYLNKDKGFMDYLLMNDMNKAILLFMTLLIISGIIVIIFASIGDYPIRILLITAMVSLISLIITTPLILTLYYTTKSEEESKIVITNINDTIRSYDYRDSNNNGKNMSMKNQLEHDIFEYSVKSKRQMIIELENSDEKLYIPLMYNLSDRDKKQLDEIVNNGTVIDNETLELLKSLKLNSNVLIGKKEGNKIYLGTDRLDKHDIRYLLDELMTE